MLRFDLTVFISILIGLSSVVEITSLYKFWARSIQPPLITGNWLELIIISLNSSNPINTSAGPAEPAVALAIAAASFSSDNIVMLT